MSNQLKKSTSPYLLQHAEPPVNWYMWSDEAFEAAQKENKPILLSIGYSTCHNLCDGVQLYTSFRDGKRSEKAFLDDYAYYISALIELYNSTLDSTYLNKAEQFCGEPIMRFTD